MGIQTSTDLTDDAAKVAENVRAAREGLAVHSRDREANHFLCDLEMFDKLIARGESATALGRLTLGLSLGGLKDVAYSYEDVADVREAIRAYGKWLIEVADKAR